MHDNSLDVPGYSVDHYALEVRIPRDRVGGSNGPLRRNQYAVTLIRHINESRKLRGRNPILRVIHVMSDDDGASG
jgi:hypothetical protein